jgi:hypothetical protein
MKLINNAIFLDQIHEKIFSGRHGTISGGGAEYFVNKTKYCIR